MDAKSRAKSLAIPCVRELDQGKVGSENQYFWTHITTRRVGKVLIRDLISTDHLLL